MLRIIGQSRWLLLLLIMWLALCPGGVRAEESEAPLTPVEQALAPIALYPDSLLGNLLIATTYPDDLRAAYDWLQEDDNSQLSTEEKVQATEAYQWDQSVVALLATPDVIQRLGDDMAWTYQLADIFTNKSDEMYAAIQHLRNLAYEDKSLVSNDQVQVKEENGVIYINSAQPDTIVVPEYNVNYVYGLGPSYGWEYSYWPAPILWNTYFTTGFLFGSCWDWAGHGLWWGPGYNRYYWNGAWTIWDDGHRWLNPPPPPPPTSPYFRPTKRPVRVDYRPPHYARPDRPHWRPPHRPRPERPAPGGIAPGGHTSGGPASSSSERPYAPRPDFSRPSHFTYQPAGGTSRPELTRPVTGRPGLTRPGATQSQVERRQPATVWPGRHATSERQSIGRPSVSSRPQWNPNRLQTTSPWQYQRPQTTVPGLTPRPSVSNPALSRPSVSRPSVSRPSVSNPSVSRPSVSRPQVTEMQIGRPRFDINRYNRPYSPPATSQPRPSSERSIPSLSPASRPAAVPSYQRPSLSPRPTLSQPSLSRPSISRPASTFNRSSFSRPSSTFNRPSVSRPSPSFNRPSVSRPSPSFSRPSVSRPSPSVSRPSFSRPSPSFSRPSVSRPSFSRPSFSRPGGRR